MRVYPHHNNVIFWRVWEAGECLAKYLIKYPNAVRGRYVMEVGSGVSLTGLVVAGLCPTSRVSLTDFTNTYTTNIAHNAKVVNQGWLEGRGVLAGKGETLTTMRDPRGLYRCTPI